ncbi:hypothetical protein [uncultured Tolumonas sp.]|uniref:hypothetical protein n=1 Tax=uncultured Tolumonas sp. TaxID=263765 RepID=UPI002A0A858B|nr:hypothetical protein [uncultured Tolumonas sp.]
MRSVFEFIQELAQIRILPPDSQVEDYLSLIAALPQDEARLGEILVASGLLTANELTRSLQKTDRTNPDYKNRRHVSTRRLPFRRLPSMLPYKNNNRSANKNSMKARC